MYCKFRIRRNFIIASASEQFCAEVLIAQKKEIVAYTSGKFSKVQYKYSTYDSQLVSFFKNIEATDIFSYFNKEELILNQYKRPRLQACYNEIPSYQRQLILGICHEVYINTRHPEEYKGFIPNLCSSKAKEYTTKFRTNFMFRIWSVWEERNYVRLYSSVQMWELHQVVELPNQEYVKFSKKDLVTQNEALAVAREFFQEDHS